MITDRIVYWFRGRWLGADTTLAASYLHTFSSSHGRLVLNHLMDNVYCTVYEGTDPNGAVVHNARRSVVHEILQTLDAAENPLKHQVKVEE